jgi:hypothetical protein
MCASALGFNGNASIAQTTADWGVGSGLIFRYRSALRSCVNRRAAFGVG